MTSSDRDPGEVRPYAITGGRTRPASRLDLPLEALVRITRRGQAALPLLALEWRDIAVLSQRPVALAELSARLRIPLAARLRIPLGVGRVLVADMVAEGLLTVLDRDALEGDGADPALLGRVLDGLRSI